MYVWCDCDGCGDMVFFFGCVVVELCEFVLVLVVDE